MKTAKTYWEYAQECMQLARAMPQHRASLLDMASVWTDLAAKAEAQEKKAQSATKKEPQ
jgi:hypothetical protein